MISIKPSNDKECKQYSLGVLALLSTLEGLICLGYLFILPKDPESDWLFGYSFSRSVMISFAFFADFLWFLITIKLFNDDLWVEKIIKKIINISYRWYFFFILISTLYVFLSLYILTIGFLLTDTYIKVLFLRSFPFILWFTMVVIQILIFAIVQKQDFSFLGWLYRMINKPFYFFAIILFSVLGVSIGFYINSLPTRQLPILFQSNPDDIRLIATFWIFIFAQCFLILFIIRISKTIQRIFSKNRLYEIATIFFFLGILLFILSLSGAIIYYVQSLSTSQVINTLNKEKTETNQDYAQRIVDVIHQQMTHPPTDTDGSPVLRVPIYDNFLLFAQSYLSPGNYKYYQYCDYRKALTRAKGLCSQQAVIVNRFLSQNGIQNQIVGLGGHVVVTARINPADSKSWRILDPDYGVIIPNEIEAIENEPTLIQNAYRQKGYSQKTVYDLEEIYLKPDNFKVDTVEHFLGIEFCRWESYSYILIWIIPIIFMLPFFSIKLYQRI